MTRLRKALKRLTRDTSGASLVEATIAVPVVIIVLAGAFDFGRAYATLSTAQRGLRSATRFLSTLPQTAVCGWGLTQAKNLAVFGNTAGTGSSPIVGWGTTNISLASPTDCTGASIGVIELDTTVPFTAVTWSFVGLPNSITLTTSHQERWIGG